MEIELNFRLDGAGRTAKATKGDSTDAGKEVKNGQEEEASLIYESRTFRSSLAPPKGLENEADGDTGSQTHHRQWLDELLLDCEISDSGLMPRTFWVPAKGFSPRCQLEQMALDIFHHHVPAGCDYDPETSGAEWWAQLRPSPEVTGRYSMHDDQPDELSRTGISFHWDKDEDLRLLTGGNTYVHPHLSTVTYLTDIGGPTLALNYRVHNLTGEWMPPEKTVEGFVSWPKIGKHMVFDGRFLHAAPADLMEPGLFDKQTAVPPIGEQGEETSEQIKKKEKKLKRRHRRVTFLVNVWLNFKPFDVKPFPDTMIDKMSGTEEAARKKTTLDTSTEFEGNSTATHTICSNGENTTSSEDAVQFKWPMGDCDSKEFIQAKMPLQTIQKQSATGGNVQLEWDISDQPQEKQQIRIYREKEAEAPSERETEKRRGERCTGRPETTKRAKVESH